MSSDDQTQKAYRKWRDAESTYADLLAELGDKAPDKVKRSLALDLAAARNKADDARDKFFKRALK
jgi:hypothetical protein